MQPTPEQEAIIGSATDGGSFKIYAAAGSGKTTTMRLCAESMSTRALYIAFNKSVADEARGKFPRSATVATAHSLAFREVGRNYKSKLVTSLWKLKREIAPRFETAHAFYGGSEEERSDDFDHVLTTFNSFLSSADYAIGPMHVPEEARDPLVCLKLATVLWRAAVDTQDKCPITHDVYFKLWQLSRPVLPYQTILIDEAQDLSPVMLDIVNHQKCQKIFVGDPYQQIYAWRGAVNALESLDLPFHPLTASFRFGQQPADVANAILASRKAPFSIQGLGESDDVRVGLDPEATGVVARSNAGLVASAVKAAEARKQIHFFGGVEDLVQSIEGAFALYKFGKTRHDLFSTFKNWAEAQKASETTLGSSFRPFVKLVETYLNEVPMVCTKLRSAHVDDPTQADVRFGTTHKFKGQEAERLQVGGDYPKYVSDDDGLTIDGEAANVMYVAATRAKQGLALDTGFRDALMESLELAHEYWESIDQPLQTSPVNILPAEVRRGHQPQRIQDHRAMEVV